MLVIAIGTLQAAEIYQWRDSQGHVQFGDKPPVGAAPIEIKRKLAPTTPGESTAARRERTNRLLNEYAAERSEQQEKRKQDKAARIERRRVCGEARDHLYEVEDAGYLYSRDAQGNKQILPDVELRAERERARKTVKDVCVGDAVVNHTARQK